MGSYEGKNNKTDYRYSYFKSVFFHEENLYDVNQNRV